MDIHENIKKEFGQDYVLVLEKSSAALVADTKSKDYILEGIAAVFGQENNNHRIYEEKEYLPHLDYLQKKIEKSKLLGELDHPANFETSLKNASHIVEKLEYDKDNRNVKIRVRLINGHPAGEMAKALVEAGVPLSISSRAAGVVKENKKVQIKKIFTYDLVADPGFEQAQLDRIYESVMTKYSEDEKPTILRQLKDISGDFFGNYEGTKIYKVEEGNLDFLKAIETQEKNTPFEMTNGKFVTVDEMNEYSRIIKSEMDKLKEKMKDAPASKDAEDGVSVLESKIARIETYMKYLAENVDKTIQYSEYLAENMDKNIEYSKYLAENLDKTITYSEYLAENLDKNISYSEYLAENLDKNISYSEYLAENLDKNISYSEYLAENVDKSISYANYLAENLEKGICYSEYLAENLDKSISYSEYLAENVDNNIAYGEYLAESLDKGISYSEYLAEKIEKNIAYSEYIAENVNIVPSPDDATVNTKKVNEQGKVDYSTLSTKINTLLESVTKQKAASALNESRYDFYKVLDEDARKEFNSLDETKKEKVVSALQKNAWFTKSDVHRVWESALVEKEVDDEPLFIKNMPETVKPIWESMTAVEKESIYAQGSAYKLNTAYQIKHFWSTRNLKKENVGLIKLNENESAETSKPSKVGYGNDYMSKVAEGLGKRFKK
jgi:hypothetical protein